MSSSSNTVFNSTQCYYAQILDCGLDVIKGFHIYGQVLSIAAWLSVFLGFIATFLSIYVRRAKTASSVTGLSSRSPLLNQFEGFLILYTLSCILGSTAITLSSFRNISSMNFYSLIGPRNVVVYIAITLYVDIVLSANTHRDPFIDRLRKVYLRLLIFPISIVFGLFIYQGYLSDLVHYGRFDGKGGYSQLPYDSDNNTTFTRIQFINTILWLLSFLVLLIFVLIGRRSFSRYLRDAVEPELQRERERRTGGTSSSGAATSSSKSAVAPLPAPKQSSSSYPPSSSRRSASNTRGTQSGKRSNTKELAETLKSAIWTMKWIALVLAVFLIYSIFFAMVVLFLGEPVPVYYVTLFINWWSPTGFGSGIFGIVIYQRWKQWSDLWKEDEWEAGQASSGAEELTSKVSVDVRVPRDYTENQAYSAPVSVTQPPFAPITTSQSYGQQQYSQQQYSQQSRPYPQSGPYSPTVSVPPNAVSYGGSYFGAPPATAYGSPTSPTFTYATSPTRQVDVTPRRGGRNDGYQPSDVHPGWNGGEQNHHRY